VLRINHPDGTAETFTYNTLRQVLSHTDGKGQTTRLQRTSRGLPSRRQDAKGEWIRYEYDKALRLAALVNENSAVYRFAYDASDRLSEEVRVDNLTRRFSYDAGGHLLRLDEIGYGETGERPERSTLFERDAIGRLTAKVNRDARHPFERQQVDVADLKGNHGKNPGGDFGKADALAPQGKADYSKNTWHHHKNMKTMQEVPEKIHNRFTHSGGVKYMKSSC